MWESAGPLKCHHLNISYCRKQVYEEKELLTQQRLQVVVEREEKERSQMVEDARRRVFKYKVHNSHLYAEKLHNTQYYSTAEIV